MPMHTYTAFGLVIMSDIELPELGEGSGPADVIVTLSAPEREPLSVPPDVCTCESLDRDRAEFVWQHVGRFVVERGRNIAIHPFPGSSADLQRQAVLGPVLAALLFQRRFLVLNAIGMVVHGQGVAFLSTPGTALSPMAVALNRRGYPLISGDILAIRCDGQEAPMAYPASSRLRLWPAAPVDAGRTASPIRTSGFHGFAPRGIAEPTALQRLYILSRGGAQAVTELDRQQKVVEIVRHSFISQIGKDCASIDHFVVCLRLASAIQLFKLRRSPSGDDIDAIDDIICSHAAPRCAVGAR